MNIAKSLFETAIEDLNSVEILFNTKHYNIALFQLQQSVEKFVKSFGLYTNAIKPNEMGKKINHLPHKVFSIIFENEINELSKNDREPMFVADMIPPHLRGNKDLKEKLENLKEIHSEIKKAESHKDKTLYLDDMEKFLNGVKELDKLLDFDEPKLLEEIQDDIIKTNEHFIEYFKGDENIKEMSNELIEKSHVIAQNKLLQVKIEQVRSRKFNYTAYVWVNMSFLTSPHQQTTRYPSIVNEDTPNNLYNENSIIIQYIPELVKIMRKSVENFKEVYPELN